MSRLPDRIGRSINELDIDFSRFTLAGWIVSLGSLCIGLIAALLAYRAVVGKIRDDQGPALVFGFVMIGMTVVTFLALRVVLSRFGGSIIRESSAEDDSRLQ